MRTKKRYHPRFLGDRHHKSRKLARTTDNLRMTGQNIIINQWKNIIDSCAAAEGQYCFHLRVCKRRLQCFATPQCILPAAFDYKVLDQKSKFFKMRFDISVLVLEPFRKHASWID